ncbi:MAG TPA: 50S ribosomal protein L10 [Bacilli bacterium]|jgi:large subunit ribosomal protein L10|nr:50S ribosomal protein L10 [Acholeplasmataceae bacterium]HNZ77198.1 50S ribosomal protein L10 [Bacilli bacterium]HQK40887.1 50S ribosomal protein L10 [Flavobacterium alvei]HOD61231.1 50S ribosomal protein L10 [Bacilli bacterium]HOH61515.1 50S ribosomal protein L10 [Bacilli bacterium]
MKEATLKIKIEQVQETLKRFQDANAAVLVNPIGLNVAEVSDLRNQLYQEGIEMKVIKNNILRRAATEAGYEGIQEHFVGPSAVAFSKDATIASKIIYDFAKKNDKLKVKGGIIDGKFMDAKDLKVFAGLPNKQGMLAMLLSVLQAPIRNLACAVKAVAEKEV